MIRQVKLEHWRSIEKLDLELGPMTVIVGPNGSGKSNFIDALRFVRDATAEGLDNAVAKRRGIESIRQWRAGEPWDISITLNPFEAEWESFSFSLATLEEGFRVDNEEFHAPMDVSYSRDARGEIHWDGKTVEASPHLFSTANAISPDELLLRHGASRGAFLAELASLVLSSFEAYSIVPGDLRRPQEPHNEPRLLATGENLTSVLRRMTRAENQRTRELLEEILSSMRLIMPRLRNIRVEGLGGHLVPLFEVEEANGELHDFNTSQISDGTLRMLGLLTALYQPDPPDVIAMEEPEQTLHPGALTILAEAMIDVSQRQQILVTTHSPHLLDYFDPEYIRAAELVNGATTIRAINPDQIGAVRDHLFTMSELMAVEGLHG